MESWDNQAIILGARLHGEHGAIVSLLTEAYGRQAGYVRGARSSKMRGTMEIGNIVDARWQARTADNLGSLSLELVRSPVSHILDEPVKLLALQSACALCDTALPEREGHPGLFHGLQAFFDTLNTDIWGEAYVMWEIAFLKELGFALDLSRCAGGGAADDLAYVSPKTGRAVSRAQGEPYKGKLLILPGFLGGVLDNDDDVASGLTLTGYFLEHWVLIHSTQGLPEARRRLMGMYVRDPLID